MKKKMKEVTFKEFVIWVNNRACDGAWSIYDVFVSAEVIRMILNVKPLFGRKKAREREWERIKGDYFNLDAEIEVYSEKDNEPVKEEYSEVNGSCHQELFEDGQHDCHNYKECNDCPYWY